MRSLMVLAVFATLGCASPRPVQVMTSGGGTLDELLLRHPVDATTNIRVDRLDRTAAASIHLVQVRGGETPHRHVDHDLAITVLRGEGVLTLDGSRRPLAAGDVAVIPRGAAHHFVKTGTTTAVALVVFAPPLDAPDSVPAGDVDSPAMPR